MKKRLFLLVAVIFFGFSTGLTQTQNDKKIFGGVVNGKAIDLPKPEFPAEAINAAGEVKVQVLIDEQGNVVSAKALSGHPLLQQAAEQAAMKAKFKPTLLEGNPVKVSGTITYIFNEPKTREIIENGKIDPSATETDEFDETDIIGGGAVFRMLAKFNSDDRLLPLTNTLFGFITNAMKDDDFPKELEFAKELPTANKERRAEIIALMNSIFQEKDVGDKKWFYSFGQDLGDLVFESLKRTALGETDNSQTRIVLSKIRDQIIVPPAGFPEKLRSQLKEIIQLSENRNPDSPALTREIDQKVMTLLDLIFDEDEE
ncbi:MAG: energy transducer TonB [Pyrinomonadaceae bacterium]